MINIYLIKYFTDISITLGIFIIGRMQSVWLYNTKL